MLLSVQSLIRCYLFSEAFPAQLIENHTPWWPLPPEPAPFTDYDVTFSVLTVSVFTSRNVVLGRNEVGGGSGVLFVCCWSLGSGGKPATQETINVSLNG